MSSIKYQTEGSLMPTSTSYLSQRINSYAVEAMPVKTLERLTEAFKKRQERLNRYQKLISDKSLPKDDRDELRQTIKRVKQVHKKHERLIEKLLKRMVSKVEVNPEKLGNTPKIKAKVGFSNTPIDVPKQVRSTLEKFGTNPLFRRKIDETIDKLKDIGDDINDAPTKKSLLTKSLIVGATLFMFYKLRDINLKDIENIVLLFMALT